MSQTIVPRTLYRHILQWAREAEGIPARLRPADVFAIVPESSSFGSRAQLSEQIPRPVSESVRNLTRKAFRRSASLQHKEADRELDRAFQAFRTLNTSYAVYLQQLQQERARNACREGVEYSIGQVFRHKQHRYKGTIFGWDRTCERDQAWAQTWGVQRDQPFYEVLPDEDDCTRLFGSARGSKYVAQENVEVVKGERVLHRALDAYFSGFSKELGRYMPNHRLEYVYPDLYEADDLEPVGQDSNLLKAADDALQARAAEELRNIVVDVG
ncbi:hypothetical protein WJX73_009611 [Symbiochloris irregularis]|uniref:Hemimethylated DNA-binding domain-containing protein n=1 Tax=Symbiochloris irregularis TaxID=706552 RepID=A0AAW1PWR5_9CHLO